MEIQENNIQKKLSYKRLLIPLLIGLGTSAYFMHKAYHPELIDKLLNARIHWILIGALFIVIRDLGYMYRIRIISKNKLSWYKSFEIIMLWEFGTAMMPAFIGGTGLAVVFLYREGFSAGKSSAYVLLTAVIDQFFYVWAVPTVVLLTGYSHVFPTMAEVFENYGGKSPFPFPLSTLLLLSYLINLFYCIVLSYTMFVNPHLIPRWIDKLFKIRILKRFHEPVMREINNFTQAFYELKGYNKKFWIHLVGVTMMVWIGRFFLVNCLIEAIGIILVPEGSVVTHAQIYGRLLVMWVIMHLSPTPGGAGVAEAIFPTFLGKYITGGMSATIALLWRLISYYPYLIIGSLILPRWIQKTRKRIPID